MEAMSYMLAGVGALLVILGIGFTYAGLSVFFEDNANHSRRTEVILAIVTFGAASAAGLGVWLLTFPLLP